MSALLDQLLTKAQRAECARTDFGCAALASTIGQAVGRTAAAPRRPQYRNQKGITRPLDFAQVVVSYAGGEILCAIETDDGDLYLSLVYMGGWFSAVDMLADRELKKLESEALRQYRLDAQAEADDAAIGDRDLAAA